MAEKRTKEFNRIINFLNNCSAVGGQSLTEEKWYKFPRTIYRIAATALIYSVFSCGYPFIKEHQDDITLVAQCLVHLTIIGQYSVKIIIYTIQRPKIVQLLDIIKEFRASNITTERENEICSDWTRKSNLVPRLIFWFYMLTITCATIIASVTGGLPYAVQLPVVSPYNSPFYEINFVYQIAAFLLCIIMTAVIDGLFAFLLQEACLQLEVIQEKISHIGESSNNEESTWKSEVEEVHDLHVMHLKTMEYIYFTNETFNSMLFFQFAASTFVVTFLLINVALSDEVNVFMVSLIGSFSLEIFLWSFFGEQARTKVNNMVEAIYCSSWYKMGPSAKKSLIIMMSCSQNEYSLNAGGLIDLTLATFVGIMRSAYSYYAVMADSTSN